MHFILQWNCRGLRPNHQDLQSIIRWRSPLIIGLQETKLAPAMNCAVKGYAVFRKDVDSQTIAHGGVLVAVHHSLSARPLLLRSPLQAVAARVHLHHRELTVVMFAVPATWCSFPSGSAARTAARTPGAGPGNGRF